MTGRPSDERLDDALRQFLSLRADEISAAALSPEAVAARLAGKLGADNRRLRLHLRLSWLLAIVSLLIVLLVALALVGSRPLDPSELVRRSQLVHEDPPAFILTTTLFDVPGDQAYFHGCHYNRMDETVLPGMQLRYLYDGAGVFRLECLHGGREKEVVAYLIWRADGSAAGWDGNVWEEDPAAVYSRGEVVEPVHVATVDWLNWRNIGPLFDLAASREPGTVVECEDWELGPPDEVAGRPTQTVSCGEHRYWIDDDTLLLLKREVRGVVVSEALELRLQAPPSELMEMAPPTVARQRLVPGQVPVSWDLPTLAGGRAQSDALRGSPAVVMVRTDPCYEPCLTLEEFVATVSPQGGRLNAAVIARYYGPYIEMYASALGFSRAELTLAEAAGIPVVGDDGVVEPAWESRGGVAFFDAEGRVFAFADPASPESLADMVDALVAGEPIPPPPIGDGIFMEGQPPPPLTGTQLDGTSFDLAALGGRPVAILSPGIARAEPEPGSTQRMEQLMADFAVACDSVRPRVACVVLAWMEPELMPERWAEMMRNVERSVSPAATALRVLPLSLPRNSEDQLWSSLWRAPYIETVGGDDPVTDRAALDPAAMVVLDAAGDVVVVRGEPVGTSEELRTLLQQVATEVTQ